jgi:alpha-beta hydrolase superfamily lysophospholipase
VLSGAAVKTDIEPGALQMLAIRCLSLFSPKKGVMQLDAKGVSRDPAVVQNYIDDPLVNHDQMSARMVAQLFRGMHKLRADAARITIPLLILHGDADTMASPEGSRFLFEHAGSADKALEIFPGLYHEIFNEPERDALFGDVLEWCDNRLPAEAAGH